MASPIQSRNMVPDPDFESGTFSSWDTSEYPRERCLSPDGVDRVQWRRVEAWMGRGKGTNASRCEYSLIRHGIPGLYLSSCHSEGWELPILFEKDPSSIRENYVADDDHHHHHDYYRIVARGPAEVEEGKRKHSWKLTSRWMLLSRPSDQSKKTKLRNILYLSWSLLGDLSRRSRFRCPPFPRLNNNKKETHAHAKKKKTKLKKSINLDVINMLQVTKMACRSYRSQTMTLIFRYWVNTIRDPRRVFNRDNLRVTLFNILILSFFNWFRKKCLNFKNRLSKRLLRKTNPNVYGAFQTQFALCRVSNPIFNWFFYRQLIDD